MNNVIQVFARNVYGNDLVYPANGQGELMAQLLKSKTFTPAQMKLMIDMGFEIEVVMDPKMAGKVFGVRS